jgi:hypothetical protein
MNKNDILIVAAAAAAVFLLYGFLDRKRGGTGAAADVTTKILDWQGWQYFSDGTVIGPNDAYYKNMVQVYAPR